MGIRTQPRPREGVGPIASDPSSAHKNQISLICDRKAGIPCKNRYQEDKHAKICVSKTYELVSTVVEL